MGVPEKKETAKEKFDDFKDKVKNSIRISKKKSTTASMR
jgi:hypothetical protein